MACRADRLRYDEAPWTGIPVAQIFVRADGFLLHMVRVIAGTLVAVGRGRFATDDLAAIVAAKDRRRAGPTLPPQGLCLLRVSYPDHQAEVDGACERRAPTLVDTPGTVS
jgi:tRNA U38,U39,U40 pseudouridine synthase TruA